MDNIFELPLSVSYIADWGIVEAVRELCQNALDSDSKFEYQFYPNPDFTQGLTIQSRGSRLTPQDLVLGGTTKADDPDSIGQFGEGFKLALLVLTRLGKGVVILNDEEVWLPKFEFSHKFNTEILHIYVEDNQKEACGLCFVITNLEVNEVEAIQKSNLHMTPITDVINTTYGRILPEMPGKLYVNGLFVCETDLDYGYDIKPEHLSLNRDRKSVEDFDLCWMSKTMWEETEQYEDIAEQMSKGSEDLKFATHQSEINQACFNHYTEKYGKSILVTSQAEVDYQKVRGNTNVTMISENAYTKNVQSLQIAVRNTEAVINPTPQETLQAFYRAKKNKGIRRALKKAGFDDIIKQANKWRN